MVSKSHLQELQVWYRAQCNGDWEHGFGVQIQTLDNPGWMLTVDLAGTSMSNKKFTPVIYGIGKGNDPTSEVWLHCRVENNQFKAHGGPFKLEEMVEIFLQWKDQMV